MKIIRLIFLMLFSLLLISLLVNAFGQVIITPQNPKDNDDLLCTPIGVNNNDLNKYNYQWFVNGIQDKLIGNIWIYPALKTKVNDLIVCAVTAPGGFHVGSAEVKIQANKLQGNMPPNAEIISPIDDSSFTINTLIFFNAIANDPDGDNLAITWNFGDENLESDTLNPIHSYNKAGQYNVVLTVSDSKSFSTSSIMVNIEETPEQNQAPVAIIDFNGFNIKNGDLLTFRGDRSFDVDGNIVDYNWDFGDGSFGDVAIAKHTYNVPGVYTITLTVTDNDGAKGKTSINVFVDNNPPQNNNIKYEREQNNKKPRAALYENAKNYRNLKISRIMSLNYKASYSRGENILLLIKLVNEGNTEENIDLKLEVTDFNYIQAIRSTTLEPKQVKWLILNLQIPVNAVSGLHLARFNKAADSFYDMDSDLEFWQFVVA